MVFLWFSYGFPMVFPSKMVISLWIFPVDFPEEPTHRGATAAADVAPARLLRFVRAVA